LTGMPGRKPRRFRPNNAVYATCRCDHSPRACRVDTAHAPSSLRQFWQKIWGRLHSAALPWHSQGPA
jgi:hypothetical protein